MAELADAHDLGSCAARRGGSSPFIRTRNMAGKTAKPTKTAKKAAAPKEEKLPEFQKSSDGTIEFRITLPWSEVKKEWDKVVAEMVKNVTVPGFRPGKAPAKVAEERLDKSRVRDEVVRKLLAPAYVELLRKHNIRPIIDPQIHVDKGLVDGEDWEFHALTCEAPVIDLGRYKEEVKKVTSKSKIVVPGKENEAPKFDEVISAVLSSTNVTIPNVLVQKEADRLLSQTLDEIKRLGMNLDQYLASTGRTAEDVRAEYANKAARDIKLEFVLQKIAETEKISVDDAEIEKTIENAKDPQEKQSLTANKYLLASIIRQQKTLDFLKSL